ncbi:unnamed protein product [Onchocerca ochengi]|uniref:Reverse transcriptase domain-containing protein n=1 Tax=Onchocerca ochengi TaxID=42157 RepID=A0A182EM50_ONCOC|nr:unnamed protein product [Onchocerca ochengi]
MSSSLNAAAQPTKENLVKLLEEVNIIDLTPDPSLSREELRRGKEAKITLEMYMDDFQLAVQQLSEVKAEESVSHGECHGTSPRHSRHPEVNYQMSCLKGDALLAVRGCDIAPENYDVKRNTLTEKFGQPTTIKKSLYNELQSIKRNDREWKATIEATERVLRQLEATGENLEHSIKEGKKNMVGTIPPTLSGRIGPTKRSDQKPNLQQRKRLKRTKMV